MASTRDQVLGSLKIGSNDFVVEVGGGHEPFGRSDVIFDKYPFDNLHRSQDLVHAAPVIIADAVRLPLPDRGCDLLFASHIIEHLPEPDRFLAEVARCSRTVYLEFPGRNRELMFGWAMHEWLVEVEGTHLTFYRNDIPQLFGDLFHSNYDFLLDAWMMRRHRLMNSHLYAESGSISWEFGSKGAFEHVIETSAQGKSKIDNAPASPVTYTLGQLAVLTAQRVVPATAFERLVRFKRRTRRGQPRSFTRELLDRLLCLHCGAGRLFLAGEDRIECGMCGAHYQQRGGLFDFDVETLMQPAGMPAVDQSPGEQGATEHQSRVTADAMFRSRANRRESANSSSSGD